MAVVCESVKQRGRHLCVAEYVRPFSEAQIGRNKNARTLVEFREQMEQQCPARLSEREIAQFVQNNGIDIHQAICQLPGFAGCLLGFELVHEFNGRKEPHPLCMVLYCVDTDGRRKVRLSCARSTDEHYVLRGLAEADSVELSHKSLIDARLLEVEARKVTVRGETCGSHLVVD